MAAAIYTVGRFSLCPALIFKDRDQTRAKDVRLGPRDEGVRGYTNRADRWVAVYTLRSPWVLYSDLPSRLFS